MKKFIIPFFLILFLSSCDFFNKNTENYENNSGNTGTENLQIEEKSQEKNLSTEYKVISKKSYFYTNPDDLEPRKAYVMKWDVFKRKRGGK